MSPEDFQRLGHRMVDWVADYMRRVESLPVLSESQPGDVLRALPDAPPARPMPASGDSWEGVFADLDATILPGITHWQSPGFFGFFPCNATGPAILAELLSAGLGIQGMLWQTSPACTELEIRMLDWMAAMLGLPDRFRSTSDNGGGVIQGTASESTLVAMVAARQRVRDAGHAADGLIAYCSEEAHSSVRKAAMICGVCRGVDDDAHLRAIRTDARHAMDPGALSEAMREDRAAGRTPFYVCATIGTTSTTAVDPVPAIADAIDAAAEAGLRPWLHIDGAHALAACVCPEHRWMLDGVARADSICFNPHKWLLTNFDCDCFWTTDRRTLVNALSVTPEYLRNAPTDSGRVIDYRDWQIPLGRRFRALKLWFVMRHYGAEGLMAHVRRGVGLAEQFESLVGADDRFEIAAPRTINLVCFRLKAGDDSTRALLDRVNASGRAFLTHAQVDARFTIRTAIGAVATRARHVVETWELIRDTAADVLD
jgi:aromatic-L-amino-acid decarboxylase